MGYIYTYVYGGLLSSGSCIQGIGGGPELTAKETQLIGF